MKNIQFALLAVCLSCQVGSANLLSNGSFETPVNPPGSAFDYVLYGSGAPIGAWTVQFTNVDVDRNNVLGTNLVAHEGNQWLDLNGLGVGGVYQYIATTPGQEYALSFWFADNPFDNGNGSQQGVPKTGNWTVRSGPGFGPLLLPIGSFTHSTTTGQNADWTFSGEFRFIADNPITRIAFSGDTLEGSTGPYLDDVRVSSVPEPGGFLLTGLGLCAIAAGRRRKG